MLRGFTAHQGIAHGQDRGAVPAADWRGARRLSVDGMSGREPASAAGARYPRRTSFVATRMIVLTASLRRLAPAMLIGAVLAPFRPAGAAEAPPSMGVRTVLLPSASDVLRATTLPIPGTTRDEVSLHFLSASAFDPVAFGSRFGFDGSYERRGLDYFGTASPLRTISSIDPPLPNGATHFAISGADFRITLLGGSPSTELARWTFPFPIDSSARVADVDADGDQELVALTGTSTQSWATLVAIDLVSGAVEWSLEVGGEGIALGQLDADAALEIVIGNTPDGRVIDGATRLPEFVPNATIAGNVHIANVDDDAALEFFDTLGSVVRIHESQPYALASRSFPIPSGGLDFGDIDGDGRHDVIVVTSDGRARAYALRDGTLIRDFVVDVGTPRAFAVAELDGAPPKEILVAGTKALRVFTLGAVPSLVHEERLTAGPWSIVASGEIDGVAGPDVFLATTRTEETLVGSVIKLDAASQSSTRIATPHVQEFQRQPSGVIGQFDADAAPDLLVTTGRNLFVLDPASSDLQSLDTAALPTDGLTYIDNAGDYDGDGRDEIVGFEGHTGFVFPVRLYAPATGQSLGVFTSTSGAVMSKRTLDVAQFDDDAAHEVAVCDGGAAVIDLDSPTPWSSGWGTSVTPALARVTPASTPTGARWLVGVTPADGWNSDGFLSIYDARTHSLVKQLVVADPSADHRRSLSAVLALGGSARRVLVAGRDFAALIDAVDDRELARTAIPGVPAANGRNIVARRMAGGAWEITLVTDIGAVLLDVDAAPDGFRDDFE